MEGLDRCWPHGRARFAPSQKEGGGLLPLVACMSISRWLQGWARGQGATPSRSRRAGRRFVRGVSPIRLHSSLRQQGAALRAGLLFTGLKASASAGPRWGEARGWGGGDLILPTLRAMKLRVGWGTRQTALESATHFQPICHIDISFPTSQNRDVGAPAWETSGLNRARPGIAYAPVAGSLAAPLSTATRFPLRSRPRLRNAESSTTPSPQG